MAGTNETFPFGSYIVLSDGSTFDVADGCTIVMLTEKGQTQLESSYDMSGVDDDESMGIPLRVLIDMYNERCGSNL